MSVTGAFELIQGIITFVLAALPWLFPNLDNLMKLALLLLILLLSAVLFCCRKAMELKDIKNKLRETTQRHTALAVQFDEKTKLNARYRRSFANLSLMLHMAAQNTKDAKFLDIYRAFILTQEDINDGGHDNG